MLAYLVALGNPRELTLLKGLRGWIAEQQSKFPFSKRGEVNFLKIGIDGEKWLIVLPIVFIRTFYL